MGTKPESLSSQPFRWEEGGAEKPLYRLHSIYCPAQLLPNQNSSLRQTINNILPVRISISKTKGMNMDIHSLGNGDGSAGSNVPRFFKIISDPGTHRLRLPIEFMRRHGHSLTDRVSVKVPSGLVWKVELIHSDGETWLHRGWQQFEEYYSINVGHLLSFEYIGNSLFEVHIFDTTATEINYFHYDHSIQRGLNQAADEAVGIESDSDDSVVFLKEILTGKDGDGDGDGDDDTTVEEVIRPSRWGKNRRMQHTNSTVSQGRSKSKYLDMKRDVNDRSEAYTRALAFMSEKPTPKPFSIVVMQPSYVETKYPALNIPAPFAREVLSCKVNTLILRVSKGKTWLVRCVYGNAKCLLTTGWPKFVEDNDLTVGDICVFEVAETINMTWNVIIFRR